MKAALIVFLVAVATSAVYAADCKDNELPLDCWCRTGVQPAGFQPHLWDVAAVPEHCLAWLFDGAVCPASVDEIRNATFKGVIMKVAAGEIGEMALEIMVGDVKKMGSLFSQIMMFEKVFYDKDQGDHSGRTFWPVKTDWMPMKIYISEAVKGGGNSLKIDYDVSGVEVIATPLMDEIRHVPGSDLYIGKNWYRVPVVQTDEFVLWFALERL